MCIYQVYTVTHAVDEDRYLYVPEYVMITLKTSQNRSPWEPTFNDLMGYFAYARSVIISQLCMCQ